MAASSPLPLPPTVSWRERTQAQAESLWSRTVQGVSHGSERLKRSGRNLRIAAIHDWQHTKGVAQFYRERGGAHLKAHATVLKDYGRELGQSVIEKGRRLKGWLDRNLNLPFQ